MGSCDERRLREVVMDVTAQAGYDLEELAVRGAGRRSVVRVVVDADGGVTLDAAAEISRAISERLDGAGADDPTGSAPYTLEVTSPGIGRPLTLPRHFRRARTRLVTLVTTDGRALTGHVLGVSDTGLQLVLSGSKAVSQVEVPLADIERAKVEVEFSPPSAAVLAVLGVEAAPEPDEDLVDVDGDSADEGSADGDSADGDSADEDSADGDSADGDSADGDSADEDSADEGSADEGSADEPEGTATGVFDTASEGVTR